MPSTPSRVLVTGAAGFYGSALTRRLLADGATVLGTSRAVRLREDGVQWLRADLSDAAEVAALVGRARADLVVHLAGPVSAVPDPALVPQMLAGLAVSSLHLLEAARTGACGRLVLVGSTEEPLPGSAPASPYAAAKQAVTAAARLHAEQWGTDVVLVRPSMTYGPGQAPTKLLPTVARALLQGEPPELASGRRLGDWVHVDDVVDGLLTAAALAPAGTQVDLGTGVLTSVRDVVTRVRALLGGPEPRWGVLPDRAGEPERPADADRTAQLLGWRAQHDLDTGLAATAASWAREHGPVRRSAGAPP